MHNTTIAKLHSDLRTANITIAKVREELRKEKESKAYYRNECDQLSDRLIVEREKYQTQLQFDRLTNTSNSDKDSFYGKVVSQVEKVLNDAAIPTHFPIKEGAKHHKPMMLAERVQWCIDDNANTHIKDLREELSEANINVTEYANHLKNATLEIEQLKEQLQHFKEAREQLDGAQSHIRGVLAVLKDACVPRNESYDVTEWVQALVLQRNNAISTVERLGDERDALILELRQTKAKAELQAKDLDVLCGRLNASMDTAKDRAKKRDDAFDELRKERDDALREGDGLKNELKAAYNEASTLALSLFKKDFSSEECDPRRLVLCDSVAGIISQIDNMCAGLRKQRDEARAEADRIKTQSIKEVTVSWEGPLPSGGGGGKCESNQYEQLRDQANALVKLRNEDLKQINDLKAQRHRDLKTIHELNLRIRKITVDSLFDSQRNSSKTDELSQATKEGLSRQELEEDIKGLLWANNGIAKARDEAIAEAKELKEQLELAKATLKQEPSLLEVAAILYSNRSFDKLLSKEEAIEEAANLIKLVQQYKN